MRLVPSRVPSREGGAQGHVLPLVPLPLVPLGRFSSDAGLTSVPVDTDVTRRASEVSYDLDFPVCEIIAGENTSDQ